MADSVERYKDFCTSYVISSLSHCVTHIVKLINYITLSFSASSLVSLVDFSCLSLFVFRGYAMVLSDVFSFFRVFPSSPLGTHHAQRRLQPSISFTHPAASSRKQPLAPQSRPGNFMLELTGSMEGTSQRDPHPGRRPVIFHHLHFRATPAASQPLAPISPRNCSRREKFGERHAGAQW